MKALSSPKLRVYTITIPEGIVCCESLGDLITQLEDLKNQNIEPSKLGVRLMTQTEFNALPELD